jgi:hypothetical protein
VLHPAWSEEERALLQLSGCSRACWEQPAKDGDVLELRRRGLAWLNAKSTSLECLADGSQAQAWAQSVPGVKGGLWNTTDNGGMSTSMSSQMAHRNMLVSFISATRGSFMEPGEAVIELLPNVCSRGYYLILECTAKMKISRRNQQHHSRFQKSETARVSTNHG